MASPRLRRTRQGLALLLPIPPGLGLLAVAPPRRLGPDLLAGIHAHDGGAALLLAVLGVLAWALVAWLALGAAAAGLAAAPGAVGNGARRVSRRVTPALVRSLLSGGTVVGLALTPTLLPVAARAAGCGPVTATTAGLPSLDRPITGCAPPAGPAASPGAEKATHKPAGPAAPGSVRVPTGPRPVSSRSAAAVTGTAAGGRTIRPGDTLWAIAGDELTAQGLPAVGPAIAARWPAWWQANRTEIGSDPSLLHPGGVLHAPTSVPTHRESS